MEDFFKSPHNESLQTDLKVNLSHSNEYPLIFLVTITYLIVNSSLIFLNDLINQSLIFEWLSGISVRV